MTLMRLNAGNNASGYLGYRGEMKFTGQYKIGLIPEAKGRKKKNFKAGELVSLSAELDLSPRLCTVFVDVNPALYSFGTVGFQHLWASETTGPLVAHVRFTEDAKLDELEYLFKVCAVPH